MNIKDYLKERFTYLFLNFIGFFLLATLFFMLNIETSVTFSIFIIWFTPLTIYMILEYIKGKRYYEHIKGILEGLDKKYLLPEVMEKPIYLEEKIFYEIIRESNKAMHEHVNEYKNLQLEYRAYIEAWVHEIKTPIASSMLIIENNKNAITENIRQELIKIEGFVEQALYYARSTDVSKDYLIKVFPLKTAINNTIRRNAKDFINKMINLQLDEIDLVVYSDIKWVEFILHQIISNSIKYIRGQGGKIKIYAHTNKNSVVLTVEDNGLGISEKDIKRVFEKGFTGEHGRKFNASTGIGLYLCKNLCHKLGLDISITSQLGIGTKVNIIFPLGQFSLGI